MPHEHLSWPPTSWPTVLICVVIAVQSLSQSCLTLCSPMDHSAPGSSVPGILQARILEWVAMPSSRDLFNPGIESACPVSAGRFFTTSTNCQTFSVLWNSINLLKVSCNLNFFSQHLDFNINNIVPYLLCFF